MIYTLTLNPAVDRELLVDTIEFDTVIRAVNSRVDCGGKGFNVARMLMKLKTPCVAMGLAGGKSGERLEDELRSLGIETDFNWIDGETRTNVSIVKSDGSQYLKVNEPGPVISKNQINALIEKINSCVKAGDWWVLAGSLPPGVPSNIYAELIKIIEGGGASVMLDTSGEALSFGCKAKPTIIKPNIEEARQLLAPNFSESASEAEVAIAILDMGPKNIVISMGKSGAMLVTKEGTSFIKSPEITERNPIGAGDAMVAGIIWGLSNGKPLSEALSCGNACGAATASQNGTDMGSYELVNDLLSQM